MGITPFAQILLLPEDPFLGCVPTALAALGWDEVTVDAVLRACKAHDKQAGERMGIGTDKIQGLAASLGLALETVYLDKELGGAGEGLGVIEALATYQKPQTLFIVDSEDFPGDLHAIAVIEDVEDDGGLWAVGSMRLSGQAVMYPLSSFVWGNPDTKVRAIAVCVGGWDTMADPHWTSCDDVDDWEYVEWPTTLDTITEYC